MKKLYILFSVCFITIGNINAQFIPHAFNYSGVARNAAGQPIATSTIGIQISILKTSTTGVAQYTENHFVNTDAYGLFNLIIGAGAVQFGNINTINWSKDNYYLKIGMDANGGTNFVTMGTTQLLSVPYALHAATADSIIGGNNNASEKDPIFTNSPAKNISNSDISKWNSDTDSTNELQTLSISNDTMYLSNGGFVKLPNITGGKTYIELYGDITDAQADSILLNDLGRNTQFVLISNTTKLTRINLTNINSLMELKIYNNEVLTSVTAPSLKVCSQNLDITENKLLNSVLFPKLINISENSIQRNSSLTTFELPALEKATTIEINDNQKLTSVKLNKLKNASNIWIKNDTILSNLDLSNLTNLSSGLELNLINLTSLSINSLISSQNIVIEKTSLPNINFGSLTTNSFLNIRDNKLLINLSAGLLKNAMGINIELNPSLSNIDLGSLSSFEDLYLANNFNLNSISLTSLINARKITLLYNGLTNLNFPALTTITSSFDISFCNKLTSISVNALKNAGGININYNDTLNLINLSGLTNVNQDLNIGYNLKLSAINANALVSLNSIYINNNPHLTNVSFVGLTNLDKELNVRTNPLLSTLNINSLKSSLSITLMDNALSILNINSINSLSGLTVDNSVISNITANTLKTITSINILNNSLSSINLSALTDCEILTINNNPNLNSITINLLTTSTQLSISNSALTNLNLSKLKSINYITITENLNLNSLNISSLNIYNGTNYGISFYNNALSNIAWSNSFNRIFDLNVSNNKLPQSEINEILALLVATGQGNIYGCCTIQNQNPNAAPSGQGVTDYTTLQNWGICLYTD